VVTRCATWRASRSAPRVRPALAAQQPAGRGHPDLPAPGSNALQISDQVRATMAELKKNMPEGVDYSIVYDPTIFVRGSITP
jgi:protein-disulfide isomerase